jgi:hypothetical protein
MSCKSRWGSSAKGNDINKDVLASMGRKSVEQLVWLPSEDEAGRRLDLAKTGVKQAEEVLLGPQEIGRGMRGPSGGWIGREMA